MDGLTLTLRLAGINNQNFLMRDDETGTFWQQVSGKAISGPLAGQQLELVPCDELSAGLWRQEQPSGLVLKDSAVDAAEYVEKDWDRKMRSAPTVVSHAQPGLEPRTAVLGLRVATGAKAYPEELVLREKLILDQPGGEPVMLVAGPDGRSVRGFRRGDRAFFRTEGIASRGAVMMDDSTGSQWNFQGCAVEGTEKGLCLDRVEVVRDYWFDWRQYNPQGEVFRQPGR